MTHATAPADSNGANGNHSLAPTGPVHSLTVEEALNRIGELPPLPAAAYKALELIRNPRSDANDLAKVLSMDQALAGLVLRWANSAFFGLRYPVTTVHQAIVYLGNGTVQNLVIAASVASLFNRPVPGYGLERGSLWKHAVGMAAAARLAGAKMGKAAAEEAYNAALLADIGKLAYELLLRDAELSRPEWQTLPFEQLETLCYGLNHADLGAEMARRWNLPERLVAAIQYHHSPNTVPDGEAEVRNLVAAVYTADAAVGMLGIGLGKDGLQYQLEPGVLERIGLDEKGFESLLLQIMPLVQEAEQFLSGS